MTELRVDTRAMLEAAVSVRAAAAELASIAGPHQAFSSTARQLAEPQLGFAAERFIGILATRFGDLRGDCARLADVLELLATTYAELEQSAASRFGSAFFAGQAP